MAGPVSYERQQRANELKSADALVRIADVLEKLYALYQANSPTPAARLGHTEPLVSVAGEPLAPAEESNEP